MKTLLPISEWARRNPILVRFLLLPILFFIQGRLSWVVGVYAYLDGYVMHELWMWFWVAVIVGCVAYVDINGKPAYPLMSKLRFVAALSGIGLWFFAGNLASSQVYSTPETSLVQSSTQTAALYSSTPSKKSIRRTFRKYLRDNIESIKKSRQASGQARMTFWEVLGIIVSALVIAVGIMTIACTISCVTTGGEIALGILLGLGIVGLGVFFIVRLIRGARRREGTVSR